MPCGLPAGRVNGSAPAERVLRKGIFAIPSEVFPGGKVKYFVPKYEVLLAQYEVCPSGKLWCPYGTIEIEKINAAFQRHLFFTITFSKKILHRRSLLHLSSDKLHRFAKQIYFTVGWAYPYAQPTNGCAFYRILSSQKATAAAAATLRESTPWDMGIFTV